MSLVDRQTYVDYVGDGTTTEFTFNFDADESSVVVLRLLDGEYVPFNQTLTIGNKKVVFDSAPSVGRQFRIFRETPLTQPIELNNQDGFFPKVVENAIDWLGRQVQDLRATTLRVASGEFTSRLASAKNLANKFAYFDDQGRFGALESDSTGALIGQAAIDIVHAEVDAGIYDKAVASVNILGVTGDGGDETAKFDGKSGLFDFQWKRVRVTEIPPNVRGINGFWRLPHPVANQLRYCVPVDRGSLPTSTMVLQAGPALGMHCQNTATTWHGESIIFPHALAKYGSGGSVDTVLMYKTIMGNTWMRQELFGPTAAYPHGFVCLSACNIGGINYALVKDADHEPDEATEWRMYRWSEAQRVELGSDKLRVEAGENYIYIDREKYDLGAYLTLRVDLNVQGNAVNGMPVDAGGYTVTSVTDTAVRLSPINGAATDATVSGYGSTTTGTLRIAEQQPQEVKFTGNKSFYLALLDIDGIEGSPGVIHSMEADSRKGLNARVYITFSNKNLVGAIGGGQPMIMRLSNLTGSATNQYAAIDYRMPCLDFPGPYSEMCLRAGADSQGNWRVFGTARAGSATSVPGFWVWDENTANQPVLTRFISGNVNPWRESTFPFIVDYSGDEPWIFGTATASRSPDLPEGFGPVMEFMFAAPLFDAIDNMGAIGGAAFEWHHTMDALWQDSNTGDSPEGASIGLGSVSPMPGGFRSFSNTLGNPQGDNSNPGGTRILKVDTRQFTGYKGQCDINPDTVLFGDRQCMVYQGIAADVTIVTTAPGTKYRPTKRVYDDFLGAYDPTDNSWLCRFTGHYRFEVRCDLSGVGANIRAYVYNETDGVIYLDSLFSDATSFSLVNKTVANGVVESVYGVMPRVRCIAGKQYSVRFLAASGAPLIKASAEAMLAVERCT